jgi:serine/threonine-protein kinase TNNI3K
MNRELIAKGSTGDIYKVCDGSRVVAMKVLDARRANRLLTSVDVIFKREVAALRAFSHRNIISFVSSEQLSPSEYTITTNYCSGGSLFHLLHSSKDVPVTTKQKKKIFSDILNALMCLQARPVPIIHGDIKSLNILLMDTLQSAESVPWVKLCDFGSSKFSGEPPTFGTLTVGTIQWMPPEVLLGEDFGTPVDIYSFGMVMFELCFREIPFFGYEENIVSAKIIKGERPQIRQQQLDRDALSGMAEVMLSCWSENARNRPDINQLSSLLNNVFILSVLSPQSRMSIP